MGSLVFLFYLSHVGLVKHLNTECSQGDERIVKIVQHRQRMNLSDTLFMRVAGSIFVGLGLFFISSGKLTTLTCNRVSSNQDNCRLVSSGLLNFYGKETKLIQLQGASLANNPMDDDAARVILLTSSGYIPFTSSTNDDKAAETVSRINTFVKEAKMTNLTIHLDEREIYFPMGGFIIAMGLLSLVLSRTTKLHI